MELFDPKHLKFNFVRWFKAAAAFSIIATVLSVIGFFYPGPNYGIDFRGGVEAQVEFKDSQVSQKDLRELLDPKLSNVSIVNFATQGKSEFLITAQSESKESVTKILSEALEGKYGPAGQAWSVVKMDSVGPKIGAELRKSALLSLIYSCILITLFLYWRFDIRYSPGVLACIFHDLIFTTGFLILIRAEFSSTVVAALLTLAGYSINDTVVIYDRIRELEPRYIGKDRMLVVNDAINSTLSRTVMTAGATLTGCLVLYFLGGPTLKDFSIALFFGIIVGTYSSAFVAAPLYIWADKMVNARASKAGELAKSRA